jgi:hypothetical protein
MVTFRDFLVKIRVCQIGIQGNRIYFLEKPDPGIFISWQSVNNRLSENDFPVHDISRMRCPGRGQTLEDKVN